MNNKNLILNDATKFLNIDSFYKHIKEFKNAPCNFWVFSVCIYPNFVIPSPSTELNEESKAFFGGGNQSNDGVDWGLLEKFRYCIQMVTVPDLTIKSYQSAGQPIQGVIDASNIYGGYTIQSNTNILPENRTFLIRFLNTHEPIIEKMIYPWMTKVISGFVEDGSTEHIPKVNIAIKFWSPNIVTKDMEGIACTYMYYFTGVFPTKIITNKPKMAISDSDLLREVTFAFNDFVIIPDEATANKYGLKAEFGKSGRIQKNIKIDINHSSIKSTKNTLNITPSNINKIVYSGVNISSMNMLVYDLVNSLASLLFGGCLCIDRVKVKRTHIQPLFIEPVSTNPNVTYEYDIEKALQSKNQETLGINSVELMTTSKQSELSSIQVTQQNVNEESIVNYSIPLSERLENEISISSIKNKHIIRDLKVDATQINKINGKFDLNQANVNGITANGNVLNIEAKNNNVTSSSLDITSNIINKNNEKINLSVPDQIIENKKPLDISLQQVRSTLDSLTIVEQNVSDARNQVMSNLNISANEFVKVGNTGYIHEIFDIKHDDGVSVVEKSNIQKMEHFKTNTTQTSIQNSGFKISNVDDDVMKSFFSTLKNANLKSDRFIKSYSDSIKSGSSKFNKSSSNDEIIDLANEYSRLASNLNSIDSKTEQKEDDLEKLIEETKDASNAVVEDHKISNKEQADKENEAEEKVAKDPSKYFEFQSYQQDLNKKADVRSFILDDTPRHTKKYEIENYKIKVNFAEDNNDKLGEKKLNQSNIDDLFN